MRGPLVMAATGIKTWNEATVDVNHDLSNFIPDYDGDQHLTHYFRIILPIKTFHLGAELTLLAAVHKLAGVDALSSDEQLCPLLKTVRIPENHFGKGRSAARVVDDVLHDALDISVSLGEIHGA